MYTSGLLLSLTVFLMGYLGFATSQVSFSTHWGGGKRSSLTKDQSEPGSKPPYIFSRGKQTSVYDHTNEIPQIFQENNELLQCLANIEFNVIRYMRIILQVGVSFSFIYLFEFNRKFLRKTTNIQVLSVIFHIKDNEINLSGRWLMVEACNTLFNEDGLKLE